MKWDNGLIHVTFAVLLALAVSCTHSIHLVHVSGFDPGVPLDQGKLVEAQSEQFVILGITDDSDYVNQAHAKLLSACTSGSLQGITTQFSTSHGFLSWTNKILMRGLCVK